MQKHRQLSGLSTALDAIFLTLPALRVVDCLLAADMELRSGKMAKGVLRPSLGAHEAPTPGVKG